MAPLGLSINRLARELRVPVTRISDIVNRRRNLTADTCLRLARYFGTTPEFWMNLQSTYDLRVRLASQRDRLRGMSTPVKRRRMPSVARLAAGKAGSLGLYARYENSGLDSRRDCREGRTTSPARSAVAERRL